MDKKQAKAYPKFVIKRKQLSRDLNVVIFKRNKLSFDKFRKNTKGYYFFEEFMYENLKGKFKVQFHCDDLKEIFAIDNEKIRIKGSPQKFGIFFQLPDQTLPISQKGRYGFVEYSIECFGNYLEYDTIRSRKNGKTEEKKVKFPTETLEPRKYERDIPSSVSWSIAHPFSGGSVTPR